jgi:NAD(P)-dependent dehydrogenase (short-subunit alcohol dehydrogenase family)
VSDPGNTGPALSGAAATLHILGKVEGRLDILINNQQSEAAARAAAELQHEKAHDEFRVDILLEAKAKMTESAREKTQRWMAYLALPAALLSSLAAYLLSKYTP